MTDHTSLALSLTACPRHGECSGRIRLRTQRNREQSGEGCRLPVFRAQVLSQQCAQWAACGEFALSLYE